MKRFPIVVASLALPSIAFAADNATLITPCAVGCVTMRARDVGSGVQSMIQILGDVSGNVIYGTAGSANPNVISVQGIASGTAMPVSGTLTAVTAITNPVTAAQATAANLNATVVGTGTFAVQAAQSGTWTVQPGNTANTTAWLVTGTGGTFPVSGTAATGAALAGNPVRIGMSDGTNAQNWLAALALGDGVNGNNTGAVASWVWNGTTWDRMPGTTAGVTVRNPTAANLNATVVGAGTAGTPSGGVVSVQGVASMTPIQVQSQGTPNVTLNDCSGAITVGGTAQNAFTASAIRHGFIIQNINDTVADEEMWISLTTTAAARTSASYGLNPGTNSTSLVGGSFSSPVGMGTSGAVSIVSATTGKKYSCTWW